MKKYTLFELEDYILNRLLYFCDYYKNENITESSYSDWNIRDVLGHINSWINIAVNSLDLIKQKESFDDFNDIDILKFLEVIGNIDLLIFNNKNYKLYLNKSLKDTINDTKIILEKYKIMLKIFDKNGLLDKEFPEGFSFSLLKYMAMDIGIHPIMHIMQHYLKRRDYNEFIKEVESSKIYFVQYSGNNVNEYNFTDYFENKEEKINRFVELGKINKNEFINEIIKINKII